MSPTLFRPYTVDKLSKYHRCHHQAAACKGERDGQRKVCEDCRIQYQLTSSAIISDDRNDYRCTAARRGGRGSRVYTARYETAIERRRRRACVRACVA